METLTLLISSGKIAGHGVASFHPGVAGRPSGRSIGDQQAQMALRACREPAAPQDNKPRSGHDDLLCLHCGATMRLLEGEQLGASLRLSAECPRCGCLRATYIELAAAPQRFLEIPQEASFD
jgi:hypothetical protein